MSRDGFLKRVYAVAFTDAVHRTPSNKDHRIFFGKNAINWICSKYPLDTHLKGPQNNTRLVSAGTTEHERTSSASIDSVFTFLSQKYSAIEPAAKSSRKPPQGCF
ncbi:hypothetical protein NP493_351g01000 [Ridgeia piscesae]|uniref:Uncharacterized protein n=1 Tax=Ridgeia piscesae TaxID=27915 RepID=A0AAD9L4V9_RIDPI|nr:hypothetical protein NP493_351g01000 [Ridgeia piscesae]